MVRVEPPTLALILSVKVRFAPIVRNRLARKNDGTETNTLTSAGLPLSLAAIATDSGDTWHFHPTGTPEQLKEIAPVKPPVASTVTGTDVACPIFTRLAAAFRGDRCGRDGLKIKSKLVPDSHIVCGLLVALLVKVSCPDLNPRVPGWNPT